MDGIPLIAKIMVILLVGLMAAAIFVPNFRQLISRVLTTSETVVIPTSNGTTPLEGEEQELNIITLLGFDAIPAILSPRFVSSEAAEAWMDPDEQVMGLSINGENKAYSIRMLSRHEIVNDTVGGVPVAVTW